ncbi:unnamed protein product [Larinioides sclopetarius]|uniref:Uncharacterized protein n=1 Tax=Larinioides sclopetarius TaxID=280406 RepID=A0AAV1Z4J6_9ARAC
MFVGPPLCVASAGSGPPGPAEFIHLTKSEEQKIPKQRKMSRARSVERHLAHTSRPDSSLFLSLSFFSVDCCEWKDQPVLLSRYLYLPMNGQKEDQRVSLRHVDFLSATYGNGLEDFFTPYFVVQVYSISERITNLDEIRDKSFSPDPTFSGHLLIPKPENSKDLLSSIMKRVRRIPSRRKDMQEEGEYLSAETSTFVYGKRKLTICAYIIRREFPSLDCPYSFSSSNACLDWILCKWGWFPKFQGLQRKDRIIKFFVCGQI